MGLQCCTGANMRCTMGTAPSVFSAMARPLTASGVPAGTINDHIPMLNIAPFGMCQSLANPMVAAATAAASGTLTPQPCIPATAAPWSPGSARLLVAGVPALNNSASLNCLWSGTITFSDAGQMLVTVP
jgi:hypothetical protein